MSIPALLCELISFKTLTIFNHGDYTMGLDSFYDIHLDLTPKPLNPPTGINNQHFMQITLLFLKYLHQALYTCLVVCHIEVRCRGIQVVLFDKRNFIEIGIRENQGVHVQETQTPCQVVVGLSRVQVHNID